MNGIPSIVLENMSPYFLLFTYMNLIYLPLNFFGTLAYAYTLYVHRTKLDKYVFLEHKQGVKDTIPLDINDK